MRLILTVLKGDTSFEISGLISAFPKLVLPQTKTFSVGKTGHVICSRNTGGNGPALLVAPTA